jgi:hypothetical protein
VVPNSPPGHTIHFGRKTLRVMAVRDHDAGSPPVLVIEQVVNYGCIYGR